MRRLILLAVILTSCAAASETVDEGIVISPAERRVLLQKMIDLQGQVDDLTEQIRQQKEKYDVAHNCA